MPESKLVDTLWSHQSHICAVFFFKITAEVSLTVPKLSFIFNRVCALLMLEYLHYFYSSEHSSPRHPIKIIDNVKPNSSFNAFLLSHTHSGNGGLRRLKRAFITVPEERNIALADSANVAQEDTFHIPSPKPILTDFGMSVNPRSGRFIGLLVAYILITLLVVYMVVCAVCFQPRKCLSLVGRDADGEGEPVPSPPPPPPSARTPRGRRFNWRWFQPRAPTSQAAAMPLVLPRTNPHFSRSVNGERFLHYPVHFRLAPNLPSTTVESPTEDWDSSNLPQHLHHQPHRHQRPMLVDATWNHVNEMDPPLPPLGAPISYYD